jgi:hypothetical protein
VSSPDGQVSGMAGSEQRCGTWVACRHPVRPRQRPSHRVKGAVSKSAGGWAEGAPSTRRDRASPGQTGCREAPHLREGHALLLVARRYFGLTGWQQTGHTATVGGGLWPTGGLGRGPGVSVAKPGSRVRRGGEQPVRGGQALVCFVKLRTVRWCLYRDPR